MLVEENMLGLIDKYVNHKDHQEHIVTQMKIAKTGTFAGIKVVKKC